MSNDEQFWEELILKLVSEMHASLDFFQNKIVAFKDESGRDEGKTKCICNALIHLENAQKNINKAINSFLFTQDRIVKKQYVYTKEDIIRPTDTKAKDVYWQKAFIKYGSYSDSDLVDFANSANAFTIGIVREVSPYLTKFIAGPAPSFEAKAIILCKEDERCAHAPYWNEGFRQNFLKIGKD